MKYKRYIFPVLMGFTMSNIMLLANTGKIILPAIFFTSILSLTGLLRIKGYSEGFWMFYFGSLSKSIVYGYVVSVLWNVVLDKLLQKKEISK
ncbi:hypothetical protein [Lachnospira multipara]|uniref:hypothetical protein n=1 Tax=Lachnospira multipara TaxID=28051 RepID=UPI0004E1A3A4|nr:hypothetical protein [Lachnospira multipara]